MKALAAALLLFPLAAGAQDFCAGFQQGVKDGACYGSQYGCTPPLPPLCPLPRIGETTYQHGYQRGFLEAARPQPSRPSGGSSIYESFQRGRALGAERRAERQAAEQNTFEARGGWRGVVEQLAKDQQARGPIYDCNGTQTPVAGVGCVVIGFSR